MAEKRWIEKLDAEANAKIFPRSHWRRPTRSGALNEASGRILTFTLRRCDLPTIMKHGDALWHDRHVPWNCLVLLICNINSPVARSMKRRTGILPETMI